VLEATGSNLFAARSGSLATPPLAEGVLPGVTRNHVMRVAGRCGFVVSEEPLMLSELFEADEVVLTSSLREIYPVREIDGRPVKRSGVAERLRGAYRAAVREALGLGQA